jgi:ubiquinone biosynthesis protein
MRGVRLFLRAATIALFLLVATLSWLLGWLVLVVSLRGRARRETWFGTCILALFRRLGATFIKVGQIMSTRPDLFPPHVIRALEKLQDQVGPFPTAHAVRYLADDFGAPVTALFETFDPQPIASASVAQVHRARLRDGRLVAVKVRRPKVVPLADFDLSVMRLVARALALLPSIRLLAPVETVEEFGRGIHMQMDFTVEAANNRRFRALFEREPDVLFPELVPELCSKRVLTMAFIEGQKILQVPAGAGPRHDPTRLARIGFKVLLKMIFEDGFVHADLHPGNIFVTADGKVALLDLGLVGELDDVHRLAFARYFAAWAQGDGKTMARIIAEHSPSAGKIPDPEGFSRDVEAFVQRYWGKQLGEIQVSTVVFDMMQILRRHRVRVNATFTMVNIAIAVTEGIGKQLDPRLDLMQEALPFFARMHGGAARGGAG